MGKVPVRLPRYNELPVIGEAKEHHAWGLFGSDDVLGTVNLLTPDLVKQAARLVKTGKLFNLSLPLNEPNPPLNPFRHTYRNTYLAPPQTTEEARDEVVDNFYPQSSSQIDGLEHVCYPGLDFYNGRQEADCIRGPKSIQQWAKHGIVGRGVLLDVARYTERNGTPLDPREGFAIMPELLQAVAASEGVTLQPGDILLLRTGWLTWILALDPNARAAQRAIKQNEYACPGLYQGREMAAFLWDHRIVMVAADTRAVEKMPREHSLGWLHHRLLTFLGMPLGEYWWLDELADDCAGDHVYEAMVVVIPWNMPESVGSPANAVAIK